MTNYNTLLSKNCDKYWEDLTSKEKELLVKAHVEYKPTVIPDELQFQNTILDILNMDIDKIYVQDAIEEVIKMRNLLFQAIKEDVERDLERKQIEQMDADEWLDSINEQLKTLKQKKIKHMSNKILEDYAVNGYIKI